jgi:hypothetical protein
MEREGLKYQCGFPIPYDSTTTTGADSQSLDLRQRE